MLNVLNTAETVILANAATKAIFGTDVASFALDGWVRPMGAGSNNSWEVSAAELVKGLAGGGFGQGSQWLSGQGAGLGPIIQKNLADNGAQALATMVAVPIAFKVAKKVLGKPLINPANRLLKSAGLSSVVKV